MAHFKRCSFPRNENEVLAGLLPKRPDSCRTQKKIGLARQGDAELLLLQVLLAEMDVLVEQRLFREGVVGRFCAVEHFAVGPAGVGKSQDHRAAGGEVVLHQRHEQRLEVDARALQRADADDEVEPPERQRAEGVDVVDVKRDVGLGEALPCSSDRGGGMVDADQFHRRKRLPRHGADQFEFVAGVDAEVQHPPARFNVYPPQRMPVRPEKGGFFVLADRREGRRRAVFFRFVLHVSAVERRRRIEFPIAQAHIPSRQALRRHHAALQQFREVRPRLIAAVQVGDAAVRDGRPGVGGAAEVGVEHFEGDRAAGRRLPYPRLQPRHDLRHRLGGKAPDVLSHVPAPAARGAAATSCGPLSPPPLRRSPRKGRRAPAP